MTVIRYYCLYSISAMHSNPEQNTKFFDKILPYPKMYKIYFHTNRSAMVKIGTVKIFRFNRNFILSKVGSTAPHFVFFSFFSFSY